MAEVSPAIVRQSSARWRLCQGLLLLFVLVLPPAAQAQRKPLLMQGKTSLFQRIIVRPGAALSPGRNAAGSHPIPGFSVYFVYGRQNGWLEVGRAADGAVDGFLPEAQAIDWRHTMVAAFTNPAHRQPVLFLKTKDDELALMNDANPGAKADQLRQAAQAGSPGPVEAMEPADRWVDINHRFYLLPILDAEMQERLAGDPLRLLEVVSAPADPPSKPDPAAEGLRNYRAGVVFLMDTTMSMQPYIERTRAAIHDFVQHIGGTVLRDKFRFGLVAYRDSLADSPGLEYATKVYAKPDFTQPMDAVLPAIDDVRDSKVSSTGFDEDPIGGLKTVLDDIDWSGLSGKFVILVTDAGARDNTHPHSITGLNIAEIRSRAEAEGVAVMVVHLLTPEGGRWHDHEHAQSQYSELSQFHGLGTSLYYPVQGGSPDGFSHVVQALTDSVLQQVAASTGVSVDQLQGPPAQQTDADRRMHAQVAEVAEAMRLARLGRTDPAQAPDVVHGWTTDRDLNDTSRQALDVRVLLTRNQLSDLADSLRDILRAGRAGQTAPQTFFTQLRSAFAAAARDPDRIAHATTIGTLLPEYLQGLPYRSEVMDLTEDDWLAKGPVGEAQVLNDVDAKLQLYREYDSHPDLWQDVTHSGQEGEKMFPVPIADLP